MSAPTPETRTAIVLLNWSSVRPSGTWNMPLIPIHVNSAAVVVCWAKIRQAQRKLTTTAATEIKLLNAFHRRVNSVIRAALDSGASRMIQDTSELITSAPVTNDEWRMSNDEGTTKSECQKKSITVLRHLRIRASFVIR